MLGRDGGGGARLGLRQDRCTFSGGLVAGVPKFTPHGLRRMAVDRMARAGVEPSVAASITGHDPNVMLQHYRAVSDDDLRLVAQRADLGWFARALYPALETQ